MIGNFSVSVVKLVMVTYSRVRAGVLTNLESANDCVRAMRVWTDDIMSQTAD